MIDPPKFASEMAATSPTALGGFAAREGSRWLVGFVLAGVVFEVGLFLFADTPLRMPLRIGIYALSLELLFRFGRRSAGQRHPAAASLQYIALVLCLTLFNPNGGGLLAGVAQASLYLAVLAPLVWVSALRIDKRSVRKVLLILWSFYGLSAATGALQVAYPHRFDGAMASNIDEDRAQALSYVTSTGDRIVRPKGLTDTPGGAGPSGVYAIIVGLGLLLTETSLTLRASIAASMAISLFSIFLSHGRTNIVIVAIAALSMLAILALRGERGRFITLSIVVALVITTGTTIAFTIGGRATTERWETLLADDPSKIAYDNRGHFFDDLLNKDVYDYPLGAGSGRWGMMNVYFGNSSHSIWVEMMWQALLYDGGIPLVLLYIVLLSKLLVVSWRTALRSSDRTIACWAAVAFSLTLSTCAASFSFPIFIKQAGLEMFLLHACLFGITRGTTKVSQGASATLGSRHAHALPA